MNDSQVKDWPHFDEGLKFLVGGKLLDTVGREDPSQKAEFNARWDRMAEALKKCPERALAATQFAIELAARAVYRPPVPEVLQNLTVPLPPELLAAIRLGFAEFLDTPIPDEKRERDAYGRATALYAYLWRERAIHRWYDLSDGEKLQELTQEVRKAITTRFPEYGTDRLDLISELSRELYED